MKFARRNDLSSYKRLHMALSMSCGGKRGLVTEMAREYKVSRQFLYDKLMLCMRLHGNSSTEGISRTLAALNWGPDSTGHISEFLHATAKSCSLEIPCKGTRERIPN